MEQDIVTPATTLIPSWVSFLVVVFGSKGPEPSHSERSAASHNHRGHNKHLQGDKVFMRLDIRNSFWHGFWHVIWSLPVEVLAFWAQAEWGDAACWSSVYDFIVVGYRETPEQAVWDHNKNLMAFLQLWQDCGLNGWWPASGPRQS